MCLCNVKTKAPRIVNVKPKKNKIDEEKVSLSLFLNTHKMERERGDESK